MDDDWDLHAVVRGCAAVIKASNKTAPVAAPAINNDYFPGFPSNFDPNSFDFSDDPFQGLHDIYQEFCGDDPPPPPPFTANANTNALVSVVPSPLVLQPHQHVMQPFAWNMQQIQENIHFNVTPPMITPPQNFAPPSFTPPIRPRRRKNQQIKMVSQMTQEELSADSWAWRKYGQKPIKGSPYPRNYYRCSTSKGCAARKQVERSPNDAQVFVVTYSGEHTHPRPTHRNSLSGTTRTKFVPPPPKTAGAINAVLYQKGAITSSSSPATVSSFSPATPSIEGEAAVLNDDVHMAEEEDGDGDGDDEENVIMNPNDLMNDDDDVFRAFQDSDYLPSGGGCHFFSGDLASFPPWTPSAFNGGGGDY